MYSPSHSRKALRDCGDIPGVIAASLSVCFVAVLETLISAKIAGFRAGT